MSIIFTAKSGVGVMTCTSGSLTRPEVYFGASDRQMEFFQSQSDFNKSLIVGILFDEYIAIPDIFFFISTYLLDLSVNDPHFSKFLCKVIKKGSIVAYFRKDCRNSFVQNLKDINELGIQEVHVNASRFAETLDKAIEGGRLNSKLWPDNALSVGYKKVIQKALSSDLASSSSQDFEKFWRKSFKLRTKLINEMKEDPSSGYRRGDLFNAIHKNINRSEKSIHDIRHIWQNLADPEEREFAQRILKWVKYCYYFNHGNMFGIDTSLSFMDPIDRDFSKLLMKKDHLNDISDIHAQEFRIPSVDALLTVDPSKIFEIRDGEVGSGYFRALCVWQISPSKDTAHILLDKLQKYTFSLRKCYLQHGRSVLNPAWHIRAAIPDGPSRIWGDVLWTTVKTGAGELIGNLLIPGIGFRSIVGKFAAAIYQTLPSEKLDTALGIKTRIHVELQDNQRSSSRMDVLELRQKSCASYALFE